MLMSRCARENKKKKKNARDKHTIIISVIIITGGGDTSKNFQSIRFEFFRRGDSEGGDLVPDSL